MQAASTTWTVGFQSLEQAADDVVQSLQGMVHIKFKFLIWEYYLGSLIISYQGFKFLLFC